MARVTILGPDGERIGCEDSDAAMIYDIIRNQGAVDFRWRIKLQQLGHKAAATSLHHTKKVTLSTQSLFDRNYKLQVGDTIVIGSPWNRATIKGQVAKIIKCTPWYDHYQCEYEFIPGALIVGPFFLQTPNHEPPPKPFPIQLTWKKIFNFSKRAFLWQRKKH